MFVGRDSSSTRRINKDYYVNVLPSPVANESVELEKALVNILRATRKADRGACTPATISLQKALSELLPKRCLDFDRAFGLLNK